VRKIAHNFVSSSSRNICNLYATPGRLSDPDGGYSENVDAAANRDCSRCKGRVYLSERRNGRYVTRGIGV
jgi:hypothetical protein